MASVFWDSEVIHVDFHPRDVTVNAQYYSNLLHSNVHQGTWETITGGHPPPLQCLPTYGRLDKGNAGNRVPLSLQP
jgi:hypothetical protein